MTNDPSDREPFYEDDEPIDEVRSAWRRAEKTATVRPEPRSTVVVVSGYFNPLHIGHLRMLEAARELGDEVVVIVNNDRQQELKKGKVIIPEDQRSAIVAAIRHVDEVVLAIDEDPTVRATLAQVADRHAGKRIIFANGGDRNTGQVVPETEVCERHGIEMIFDLGGSEKVQASSNILAALELD